MNAADIGGRRIDLLDSLDEKWLKLPLAVMQDCGSAVQTLAGLMQVAPRETFVFQAAIAEAARLPKSTVRKHLTKLHDSEWIDNKGRQRTNSGVLRRSCTIAITKQTRRKIEPYGFLPWWACCRIRNLAECRNEQLPWCARAILSVWMAELCKLKSVAQAKDIDPIDLIENTVEQKWWRFSLTRLEQHFSVELPDYELQGVSDFRTLAERIQARL